VQCSWCNRKLKTATATGRARREHVAFCGTRCRQAAFRLRRRAHVERVHAKPMRFAYADPPYPTCAWRYYRRREVDHAALIADLCARFPDGWALSTSMKALRAVLPLCPAGARVCVWTKPNPPHPKTRGIHALCEAVIVVGGRQRAPGVRDWLSAKPARGGGTLPGRKPLAFCAWLFDLLGMVPGDELVDLFPGTGVVGRAWREVERAAGMRRPELEATRGARARRRLWVTRRPSSPVTRRGRPPVTRRPAPAATVAA
jgi:hypothetical protein